MGVSGPDVGWALDSRGKKTRFLHVILLRQNTQDCEGLPRKGVSCV